MDKDVEEALARIDERLDRIEATVSAYLADNTGWLVALQAIAAVTTVRQISGAADAHEAMRVGRDWSKQIAQATTPAATIPEDLATAIQQAAQAKLDTFFKGISIDRND
jgi:hypothetical protein